ncbi:MAG: hypothetical protein K9G36_06965 [Crocinitomicaceae bacterium]|nr:hypothetical protein [Crocinitomicaceae bacterium]MCF8409958.1 hypothetical protein [Crocinitomicaceae bacterium]MCF8444843.1 hypothetical protein [Crocinitomicaceae bacterium]
MDKKILILCNDFPPINSVGADRPYSWYKYFKEFNLEPIVITKNWITDGHTPFNEVSVERSVEKTEFGTIIRAARTKTPSVWFRSIFGQRLSVIRKALTLIEKLMSFSVFSFDQNRAIYKEAVEFISKNQVSLIITTGEPFVLFKYGYLLKIKNKIPWIADYRDGWYLNHVRSIQTDFLNKLIRTRELKFELKYTQITDLITTVDPELALRIENMTNKKTEVIYNGFWDFHQPITQPVEKPLLVLNHTGTLTVGQRLELLLEALVELKNEHQIDERRVRLNLVGLEYFPAQMERLNKYKKVLGKIIQTTPRLSKKEAVSMNLDANYLVNFTDPNLSAIYAKTYDYIASRKPILVIPGDKKLLEKLVLDNHLGFVLDTKDEIKSFLLNPTKWNPSDSNISFFMRKKQTEQLTLKIKNIIENLHNES